MIDVAIVGGGPGGLYAAVRLARKGFSVTVLEEHATAGEPVHCTGILGSDTFNEFDVPQSSVLNELRSLRLYSPSGREVSYSTDDAQAVVIDRRDFDQTVCQQAVDLGVQLIRGYRANDITLNGGGVSIEGSDVPQIRARACILACGANYTLQRKLGLGMPPLFLRTAQVEVPAAKPQGSVEIHFGLDVAPHGFAWTVPVRRPSGDFVRIGLMSRQDPEAYFDRFVSSIGSRWGVDESACRKPRLKMLPLSPIRKTYLDRLLVVGDAAGLVKPTTGGGIYYSILSGSLAADVLSSGLEKNELGAAHLQKYEAGWRAHLDQELDAQLTLRKLAQSLDDHDIDRFFELAQSDGIIPLIRATARFNQHRDFIVALLKHPEARKILVGNLTSRLMTTLHI